MALFGEKYGDEVRVVAHGPRARRRAPPRSSSAAAPTCRRTGDIALFKITAESAVAAGVRRIEALTGEAALEHVRDEERLLAEAARRAQGRRRRSCPSASRRCSTSAGASSRRSGRAAPAARDRRRRRPATSAKEVARHPLRRARRLEGVPAKELRGIADAHAASSSARASRRSSASVDGKAAVVVSVTDDLTASVDAVALLRAGVAELGGKGGGGRPDFAQGGGPDGARAEAALAAIERGLASQPAAAE